MTGEATALAISKAAGEAFRKHAVATGTARKQRMKSIWRALLATIVIR